MIKFNKNIDIGDGLAEIPTKDSSSRNLFIGNILSEDNNFECFEDVIRALGRYNLMGGNLAVKLTRCPKPALRKEWLNMAVEAGFKEHQF
jgi:hypothetical protein